MGVDPGLASTGVGVIEEYAPNKLRFVFSDHIRTSKSEAMPKRLDKIFNLVANTIERYQPGAVAVESIFFAKNVRSAVMMAHGRGAAILAASQSGAPLLEYSPLEIKQSVVGKGRASKDQVQTMVGILLSLETGSMVDHETDALACAICHAYRSRVGSIIAAKTEHQTSSKTRSLRETNKELLAQMVRPKRKRRK